MDLNKLKDCNFTLVFNDNGKVMIESFVTLREILLMVEQKCLKQTEYAIIDGVLIKNFDSTLEISSFVHKRPVNTKKIDESLKFFKTKAIEIGKRVKEIGTKNG